MNAIARNVLAGVLFCVALSSADAQSLDRRDGNWWRNLDVTSRATYIVGFFDGMDLGYNFSYWKYAGENLDWDHVKKATDSYNEFVVRFFKNVTNDQIADGLTSFYADYRNRSIRVNDAVWLVVNEIAGTPRVQLDKMIENWRKSATQ